jgi:hypothetical protein
MVSIIFLLPVLASWGVTGGSGCGVGGSGIKELLVSSFLRYLKLSEIVWNWQPFFDFQLLSDIYGKLSVSQERLTDFFILQNMTHKNRGLRKNYHK